MGTKITGENNGPVEENKPIEELKQDPYKLPDGFSWDEIDILDDEQVIKLIFQLKYLLNFISFLFLVKRIICSFK